MRIRTIVFAVSLVFALGLCPGMALASDGAIDLAKANLPLGQKSAGVQVSLTTQAKASPTCALLCKDGNYWRCTSKGKPVSKYWSGHATLSSQLGKVKKVFIASDVKSITSSTHAWTRYVYSSGRSSVFRYSASFSGGYLKNVKSVEFLANSKGVNKCKLIGDYAFGSTEGLKSVIGLGKTKVTQIGKRAFNRSGVKSVSLPKSLETIGEYAFHECSQLTKLEGLNKTSLSSLGANAFSSCTKLKSVSLPASCKEVPSYAFELCAGLKSVSLGSSTETIGDNAFRNCEKLASIDLPAACSKLGYASFSGCSSLSNVIMRSTKVVEHASSLTGVMTQFYGTPIAEEGNEAFIYVPASLLADYQVSRYTNPWYNYCTKFKAL